MNSSELVHTTQTLAPNILSDTRDEKIQKPKARCFTCSRKVGMTGFTCRCAHLFCAEHRLPFDHKCSFDVKSTFAKQLETSCNKVTSDKMIKI
jgi:predicted nucleic acid binding AN1-type Zn finger protein